MPSLSDQASAKVIVALAGFLGRPRDWSLIENLVPKGWSLHPVEILDEKSIVSFEIWAERFNAQIARELPSASTKILLGYSLGGRLALQALISAQTLGQPNEKPLFDGGVMVSVNPGLRSATDRGRRREADQRWAERFQKEEWSSLMQAWNSQASLQTPHRLAADAVSLVRSENEFSRAALAKALDVWSLGAQADLRSQIEALKIPMQFVTGEDDTKFTTIVRDLRMGSPASIEHVIVPRAGHRVPWDAPAQFRSILANFVSRW